MKRIFYLTDLYYKANGRIYYKEDLFITSKLQEHFNILICHPLQALANLDFVDFIGFRNTGPVIYYNDYFQQFLKEIEAKNIRTLRLSILSTAKLTSKDNNTSSI